MVIDIETSLINAVDLWDYINNELGYRFFSGIPCIGLNKLYNSMNKNSMHYVPAANENIAVGIVNGATIAGTKSCVMFDHTLLRSVDIDFNINNELPLLVISGNNTVINNKNIKHVDLSTDYRREIKKALKNIRNKILVLSITDEVLV